MFPLQSFAARAHAALLRTAAVACALGAAHAAPARAQAAAPAGDSLSVTIEDALNRAMSQGDEVRLAERRASAAGAAVTLAESGRLPKLTVNGAFTHVYESARAQAVGSIFNQPNTYNTNANLSVPLYQGGRVSAGIASASRLRGAAQADVADTRQTIALDVLAAYLNGLLDQRLVEIQEANLALAQQQLTQAEQLEHAGRSSRYDVLRARVQFSNLQPPVIQARADRDAALLELKRLMNLPAEAPIRLVSALSPDQVRRLAGRVGALPADSAAVDSLPVVRAAALRASASRAQVTVARADYLPSLSVFIQSGYQAFPLNGLPVRAGSLDVVDCPAGSAAGRVCTQQNGGWFPDRSAGLQVTWPVFDGFRTRANVAAAKAQADIAATQLRQARENAAIAAANARNQLTAAEALYDASRQNVSEAEEAYRLAALRFQRGLGTQLEVQDAQLQLLTARSNEARATHELYLAAATLSRSLGQAIPLPAGGTLPAATPR
jgi:outer membrane protein TolC